MGLRCGPQHRGPRRGEHRRTWTVTQQPREHCNFKNASGSPTFYSDASIAAYFSCTFDNKSNLFFVGQKSDNSIVFAELPNGSSTIRILNLAIGNPGAVQWDGHYIVVGVNGARLISRVRVSGSHVKVVGSTKLFGKTVSNFTYWIEANRVLTAAGPHEGSVGLFRYPRGGKASALSSVLRKGLLGGLTVSVEPHTLHPTLLTAIDP